MTTAMRRLKRFLLQHAARLTGWLIAAWIASIALSQFAGLRLRGWWFGSLFVLIIAAVALAIWARWQREVAIRESALPQSLKRQLRQTWPQLSGRDCDLVERGMRQFFMARLRSDKRFVAMPSKAVDAYWHEFILHTPTAWAASMPRATAAVTAATAAERRSCRLASAPRAAPTCRLPPCTWPWRRPASSCSRRAGS